MVVVGIHSGRLHVGVEFRQGSMLLSHAGMKKRINNNILFIHAIGIVFGQYVVNGGYVGEGRGGVWNVKMKRFHSPTTIMYCIIVF